MELEMPTQAVCPLCGDETVELKENKRGNPFFSCETFRCAVNTRPSTERARELLELHQAADSPDDIPDPVETLRERSDDGNGESGDEGETEVESPESGGDEGETPISDLFGESNDE